MALALDDATIEQLNEAIAAQRPPPPPSMPPFGGGNPGQISFSPSPALGMFAMGGSIPAFDDGGDIMGAQLAPIPYTPPWTPDSTTPADYSLPTPAPVPASPPGRIYDQWGNYSDDGGWNWSNGYQSPPDAMTAQLAPQPYQPPPSLLDTVINPTSYQPPPQPEPNPYEWSPPNPWQQWQQINLDQAQQVDPGITGGQQGIMYDPTSGQVYQAPDYNMPDQSWAPITPAPFNWQNQHPYDPGEGGAAANPFGPWLTKNTGATLNAMGVPGADWVSQQIGNVGGGLLDAASLGALPALTGTNTDVNDPRLWEEAGMAALNSAGLYGPMAANVMLGERGAAAIAGEPLFRYLAGSTGASLGQNAAANYSGRGQGAVNSGVGQFLAGAAGGAIGGMAPEIADYAGQAIPKVASAIGQFPETLAKSFTPEGALGGAIDPATGRPFMYQPAAGGADIPMEPGAEPPRPTSPTEHTLPEGVQSEQIARGGGLLPEKLPPAPVAPLGITPGADITENVGRRAILDAAKEEQTIRDLGIADREIAAGRRAQAAGIQGRLAEGRAQGLAGRELADYARQGAAVGPLRTMTAPPMDLTPEAKAAIFDDLSTRLANKEISPFEYLQASQTVSKLISGQGLQPAEIRTIRQLFGDEVGDVAAARPKPGTTDLQERISTAAYNDRKLAQQQKAIDAETIRQNKAYANPGAAGGQETVDRQFMRDKWKAIAKQSQIDQQVIDDLNNPLRTTPEEQAIGRQALWQRANAAQREAGRITTALQSQDYKTSEAGLLSKAEDTVREWTPNATPEQVATARQVLEVNGKAMQLMADALPADAQNAVLGLYDQAANFLIGDTPDSFVNDVLHQQGYLETALQNSGMDPETARTVSNTVGKSVLARRYPDGLPASVQEALDSTKRDFGSRAQRITSGLGDINEVAKRSTFGLTEGLVMGQGALKNIETSAGSLLTGITNRILNSLGTGLDTTGELASRRLAYGLDGVLQGRTGSFAGETARASSLWELTLGKLPVVGDPIANGLRSWSEQMANLHFNHILGTLRNLTHEGNLVIAHLAGADITDPAVRHSIANFANFSVGTAEAALNKNRALGERALMMSPSITRSQTGQILKVVDAMLHGNTAERAVASATILSTAATTLAIGKLFNDRFGLAPFEFDPTKPGFGNLTLPFGVGARGTVINPFPQDQMLKYVGQAVRNLVEGDPQAAADAMVKLGLGRSGFVGQVAEASLGYGFAPGGGYALGDLQSQAGLGERILNMTPFPPLLDSFLNAKPGEFKYEAPFGLIGQQAYSESASQARDRDILKVYAGQVDSQGKPIEKWSQLNAGQRAEYNARSNAIMAPVTGDTATGKQIQDSQKKYAAIDQTYRDNLGKAADQFATAQASAKSLDDRLKAGTDFRDNVNHINDEARTARAQQDLNTPFPTPKTPEDRAVDTFFALSDQARFAGKSDPELLAALQGTFLAGLDQKTRDYVLAQVAGKPSVPSVIDAQFSPSGKPAIPDAVQTYYDDLQKLQPYWDATAAGKGGELYLESHPDTAALLEKYGYSPNTLKSLDIHHAFQSASDANDAGLADGSVSAAAWKGQLHTLEDAERNQLSGLYTGASAYDNPSQDPLAKQYYDFLDSTIPIDPNTGQPRMGAKPDYNAGDRYLADHPDVQAAVDAAPKRPVSPTVQAYRDAVKEVADSGYWDVQDTYAQQFAQYYGLPPNLQSYGQVHDYLRANYLPQVQAAYPGNPALAAAKTEDYVTKLMAPVSKQASAVQKAWRLQSPDLLNLLVTWGFYNPSKQAEEVLSKYIAPQ